MPRVDYLLGWRAVRRGVIDFYNSNNLTYAASIAYYTLLSFFPFLLLVLSLLSRLAVSRSDALLRLVEQALPSNFDFLVNQIRELAAAPLKLSVLGTVVTIWASMGVFGAITSAVNDAWGVEKNYGFFTHKLVAVLMLLGSGVLLIAALLLISSAQVVGASWFTDVLASYPNLAALQTFFYRLLPTLLFILVVGLVFYFIPNTKVRLRDVWFGAILTGVLWRLAFAGFAWWVKDMTRFSVHGSVSAVVVFLIWVYLSAVILLYGVEVTAAFAKERRLKREASILMKAGGPEPAPEVDIPYDT